MLIMAAIKLSNYLRAVILHLGLEGESKFFVFVDEDSNVRRKAPSCLSADCGNERWARRY